MACSPDGTADYSRQGTARGRTPIPVWAKEGLCLGEELWEWWCLSEVLKIGCENTYVGPEAIEAWSVSKCFVCAQGTERAELKKHTWGTPAHRQWQKPLGRADSSKKREEKKGQGLRLSSNTYTPVAGSSVKSKVYSGSLVLSLSSFIWEMLDLQQCIRLSLHVEVLSTGGHKNLQGDPKFLEDKACLKVICNPVPHILICQE